LERLRAARLWARALAERSAVGALRRPARRPVQAVAISIAEASDALFTVVVTNYQERVTERALTPARASALSVASFLYQS
jgi:hypothetical protein